MKKSILNILLCVVCCSSLNAQQSTGGKSDSYDQLWKKVVAFEQKSLPKSASQEVDKILRKAISEGNSPQAVKAIIHQGKYDLEIDAENDASVFEKVNEMLSKSDDEVEKSVLHSMLAELYLNYYFSNRWIIDRRTAVIGFVPDDMKEWTKNIFFDRVVENLNASIAERDLLLRTKAEDYAAVVELGKDSRRFFPTLYDFLSLRAIDLFCRLPQGNDLGRSLARKNISPQSLFAPAEEFVHLQFDPQKQDVGLWTLQTFRNYMTSLMQRGMSRSLVLVEFDKLDYLRQLTSAYKSYALPALKAMLTKWNDNDFSVEIVDKIAEYYESYFISTEDSDAENAKTKEIYELLNRTVQRYPRYERIGLLQNRLTKLTQPTVSVSGQNTYPLRWKKEMEISYRNITELEIDIYQVNSTDLFIDRFNGNKNIAKRFVKKQTISLPKGEPYETKKDTITLDIDEFGAYIAVFSADKPIEDNQHTYSFAISDLSTFSRLISEGQSEFFVVDRISGKPIKNAQIEIFKRVYQTSQEQIKKIDTLITDENGLAKFSPGDEKDRYAYFYRVVSGDDQGSLPENMPNYYFYRQNDREGLENISIFTDRGIYRPGQTVYFKAIAAILQDEKTLPVAEKSYSVNLVDANSQTIATKQLRTNEFGSISGEFVLPEGKLSGNYQIRIDNVQANFQVLEYKRPTFEITFEPITKTYRFGDEVTLTGKAENYSGIKLQHSTVDYVITRSPLWWWSSINGSAEQIEQGSTITDENGKFNITFKPSKPDSETNLFLRSTPSVFSFTIEASITDMNGETQSAHYVLSVGDIGMMLEVDCKDQIEKSSTDNIRITATNLDGQKIDAKGIYRLFSVNENDSIVSQLFESDFRTGTQPELSAKLQKLPSGKYRLKLQSRDDAGNKVEAEKDFVLFSYADKRPPIKTNDWYIVRSADFTPEKPAEIMLGVSDRDIHVLFELWQEQKLLKREWVTLNNEIRTFTIPYDETYKNGVSVFLTYMKDQKFYTHSAILSTPKKSNDLKIKLDVFRDKLLPGQKEEWRMTVRDASGNPASAEVLASMYDLSLDAIYKSPDWIFNRPVSRSYISLPSYRIDNSLGKIYGVYTGSIPQFKTPEFVFDSFNWYGLQFGRDYGGHILRSTAGAVKQNAPVFKAESGNLDEVMMVADAQSVNIDTEKESRETKTTVSQIRKNFNETAFFYPQLRTNTNGEVRLAFTVPESNTRWRFRLLAHDRNLNVGTTDTLAVSQKELMITPNLPRFFRQGDQSAVSTKISNLSEKTLEGTVSMEFFDPLTDRILEKIVLPNQKQAFLLSKGESSSVSWTFDVPTDIDLLGVRIVADSKLFSDGEQHALAVLPDRMLVTESMPMDVNGNQTKVFSMDRLLHPQSSTLQNYRLSLEFASNPAWYAVQALPVLSAPDNDNAVSWFAAYYANTLGSHISKTFPKVAAMIDAWKKQGGDSGTLLSNLEKNEELKNVLIEETPWVLEAKNETEQKQRLSLLFDLNRNQNLTRTAIDKLQELQTDEGGWSWIKGFYPSRSITQYVLYGLGRLDELIANEADTAIAVMSEKAVNYIDAQALRSFEQLKKNNKNWRSVTAIPSLDLEYMFVRSMYSQYKLSPESKSMIDFYTSILIKNRTNFDLYQRSLIAVIMQRNGNSDLTSAILKSFREHATIDPEKGMFWANNRSHVFLSQSAVSVHTFIMDAFRIGGSKADEMDLMKKWLLKQKQTQLWESTQATLDAVYALLSTGTDWFSSENEVQLTIGKTVIEPQQQELGTGYFKTTWSGKEIVPDMGSVKIENKGKAPAWGALYWQYFEETDKISKTDAGLDVEKKLFMEKIDASGKQLIPLDSDCTLKVGDKIVVRLTVRSDRDFEFVHLKDMRAACLEPIEQFSGVRWQDRLIYYQTSKDASTNFYFDVLPRGTYVLEYPVYVNRVGNYSNGITTIQCMYAPEFASHTSGIRINVKE
ncbi:MAG: alpha-2-macroglobulin family protein [Bacteroidota bacterium]